MKELKRLLVEVFWFVAALLGAAIAVILVAYKIGGLL
jgi:hypothetical protein